jgi:Carboxylesterase family
LNSKTSARDALASKKAIICNSSIRGVAIDGINVFRGIPYGAPTSGTNRFMPAAKPAVWTGTRDALAFGPTAPQTADNSGTTAVGSPAQQSEDCLVLNVFTPGVNDGRKRPVMVWLHGGGFSSGSGSGRILDGTSLAHTYDVVVVTLNHRLNVFGYTYLGAAMVPTSRRRAVLVCSTLWPRSSGCATTLQGSAAIRILPPSSVNRGWPKGRDVDVDAERERALSTRDHRKRRPPSFDDA